MTWIVNNYYKFYIKALLGLNPAMLFTKINQLDWYKQLLNNWVDETIDSKSKVLEIGCSTGALTQYISDLGHTPIGVDLSQTSIDQAKSGHPDVCFQLENVLNLSFEEEVFDAVIAASVINIVDDKQKAMNEIIRVCKTGGICSVLVPSSDFTEIHFKSLLENLNLTGFSLMALNTWNKLAPKMMSSTVLSYFPRELRKEVVVKKYLNGMVRSFTLKKFKALSK